MRNKPIHGDEQLQDSRLFIGPSHQELPVVLGLVLLTWPAVHKSRVQKGLQGGSPRCVLLGTLLNQALHYTLEAQQRLAAILHIVSDEVLHWPAERLQARLPKSSGQLTLAGRKRVARHVMIRRIINWAGDGRPTQDQGWRCSVV